MFSRVAGGGSSVPEDRNGLLLARGFEEVLGRGEAAPVRRGGKGGPGDLEPVR